jgi:NAD(P)H dehydrogenase (quinone)
MKKKIAIVYHSGYGHTAFFAKHVLEGSASTGLIEAELITADKAIDRLDQLSAFDGFIFGTPTYMGNVSAPFKAFMDASSRIWLKQSWKGKWASAFTVSGSPSGDKMTTLITLATFAAQHGMYWMPLGVSNETYSGVKAEEAINRLGSSLGAMAQAGNEPAEKAFLPGDLKTAHFLGAEFSRLVSK